MKDEKIIEPVIDPKFLKPYNPAETESRIYELWEKSGAFQSKSANGRPAFSMVLPPPNVTGVLHLGHAEMIAIEDLMIRYKKMRGYDTLWVPGTDHAAIATQTKVEKMLTKEGKRRQDFDREEFIQLAEEYATASQKTIIAQLRKLGAALDWTRLAFTLDAPRQKAVKTAFKKMYDDGIIYRAYRVINWDPKGQTAISDDEIIYQSQKTTLYYFKYDQNFPIVIATTRPETKLGDTAIAVHPTDARYQTYVGQELEANFCGEKLKIKIIADDSIDPDFGTGAVGVTPAHSLTDFELAQRHNLILKPVINEHGRMIDAVTIGPGEKTVEARRKIVEFLKKENLLIKEEEIIHNLATAERSGGIIEPLPKLQWFVDVNKEFRGLTLKKLMRRAVETGEIKIVPERFVKIYFQWIDNLRDWCISRQVWYGHRIPIWYRPQADGSEEIYCGIETPDGQNWTQDPDTLDTWFSSGLWSFSVFGWPESNIELKKYHPLAVLETGYDILFFWVARMILMTTYLLGEVPFRTVYLHGLLRDKDGQKISKSLGNNIDPLSMIEKYGADALRLSLIIGVGPGNDSRVSEDKIRGYKHFANKLWNVARFVLSKISSETADGTANSSAGGNHDQKYLEEFERLKTEATADLENFRFDLAGEKLYHYLWHTLADEIIEEVKKRPAADQIPILSKIFPEMLILLHPFMPHVTEEIWQSLPAGLKKDTSLLINASWPYAANG